MRSDIIEDICEEIYEQIGISGPSDLYDPEILVNFLSMFWFNVSQDQDLTDECERIYEILEDEDFEIDDSDKEYEEDEDEYNDNEEDDFIENEDFGERIDLAKFDNEEESEGFQDSDSIPE